MSFIYRLSIGRILMGLRRTFCTSAWRRLHALPRRYSEFAEACQGFGAQHDVASCRKRESREKAKQDIFRCVRGAAPVLLSALGGKGTRGSGLAVLLSPLLCPGPALLSVGHVLLHNTPPFPPDIESNGISIQQLLPTSSKTAAFAFFETFIVLSQLARTQSRRTYLHYKKQQETTSKM